MTEQDNVIPSLNPRATKKELMDKYKHLLSLYKEKIVAKVDKKEERVEKEKQQVLLQTKKYKAADDITTGIDGLRLTVNQSLGAIQTNLEEKFKELKQFEEAIGIQQEKLKESYEIEDQSYALQALILAQEEQKSAFGEEVKKVKELWEREKELVLQERAREEDEYYYQLSLKKRKDEEEKSARKKEFEQEIQQREEELKKKEEEWVSKESEFTSLKEQVDAFPERMSVQVEKGKQDIEERLSKEHETRVGIIKKEMESQKMIFENKIENFSTLIQNQKEQIQDLHQQLQSALKQIQEVTLKTIEGSSSAHALSAVNKIAMEQAKSGSSNPYDRNK